MAIEKVTITIDKTRLFEAQLHAARCGVDARTVKNNSAFIRYLIDRYIKENRK